MPYSTTAATRLGLIALVLCCLAVIGVGVAAVSVAAAPQHIAVINLERAIYATAEAERRIAKLKRDEGYREQRETVEALQKAGQRLVTQLRKDESVLSEARQRELQRRITTAREDVEYALKKLQAMEQAVVEEVREELSDRAQTALEELMEEENISILLRRHPNVPIILYADAKYDLTLKLTDMLNRTAKSPKGKKTLQAAGDTSDDQEANGRGALRRHP